MENNSNWNYDHFGRNPYTALQAESASNPGNLDEDTFHESPDGDADAHDSNEGINHDNGTVNDKKAEIDETLNDDDDYSNIKNQDDDFHIYKSNRPHPTDE